MTRFIEVRPQAGRTKLPRARIAVARHVGIDGSRTSIRQACRDLLSFILRNTVDTAGTRWQLTKGAAGSPSLLLDDAPSEFRLSMSHCRRWIAVGLSQGTSIGVDIELIRPKSRMNAISGFLGWSFEPNDVTNFWVRWTLAEAFAKQGDGSILKSSDQTVASLAAKRKVAGLFSHEHVTALCERIDSSLILSVVINPTNPSDLAIMEVDPYSVRRWQPCNSS